MTSTEMVSGNSLMRITDLSVGIAAIVQVANRDGRLKYAFWRQGVG
jgi:hypothetical protein